jgi:hypothetical protein
MMRRELWRLPGLFLLLNNWGFAPNLAGKGHAPFPNPSHDFFYKTYMGGLGKAPMVLPKLADSLKKDKLASSI